MKRALISVSNKEGIVEFASGLEKLGYEIYPPGTYTVLEQAGVHNKGCRCNRVSRNFRGWVKMLHPNPWYFGAASEVCRN